MFFLYLPFQEGSRGHHDVVVGMSGEEFRLEDLVGIEHVVVDVDTVFLLERGDHVRLDIIGPVIDVEHLLRGGGAVCMRVRTRTPGGRAQQQRQGCANGTRNSGRAGQGHFLSLGELAITRTHGSGPDAR
jgi:hypothetical protein